MVELLHANHSKTKEVRNILMLQKDKIISFKLNNSFNHPFILMLLPSYFFQNGLTNLF